MRRVVVKKEFMRLAKFCEFSRKLAHLIGRRVLIELAEMALDRARNIRRQGCRGRAIAPLLIAATAVKIDGDFERLARRSGEKRDAPAHAEADDAEPRDIGAGPAFLQKGNSCVDIVEHIDVAPAMLEARRFFRCVRLALAVIKLRSDADVAGL